MGRGAGRPPREGLLRVRHLVPLALLAAAAAAAVLLPRRSVELPEGAGAPPPPGGTRLPAGPDSGAGGGIPGPMEGPGISVSECDTLAPAAPAPPPPPPSPPDPPVRPLDPHSLPLEALRARLEAIARGEGGPEPRGESVFGEIHRRFPGEILEPGLLLRLMERGVKVGGAARLLSEQGNLYLLREAAARMAAGGPTPFDGLEYDLAGAYAYRGEAAGRLAEEFAASPDPRPRVAAAILAQARPPRPDLLVTLASDPDPEVRVTALSMIQALLNDGVVAPGVFEEAIFAAIEDPDPRVRENAMDGLPLLGKRGGVAAAGILRTGAHLECGENAGELVVAALDHASALLLAEPWPSHLAADLAEAFHVQLLEDRPDLFRILLPLGPRILRALDPGTEEGENRADILLDTLREAGEFQVLREVLADPLFPERVRAWAAEALLDDVPPAEWESALAAWLLSAGDAGLRREFLRVRNPGFDGQDPDRAGAWCRVLRLVAEGGVDEALRETARRLLEARR